LAVETIPPKSLERSGGPSLELVAFGLVILALGFAYTRSFNYLSDIWSGDPNYSHGFLVVPAALMILWLRRDSLDTSQMAPSRWGWVSLGIVFVLRAILYELNEHWFEDATILLAAGSLAMAFGGWYLVRWCLPAIIFLGFMLPLPTRLNGQLAYPLQRLATLGSCDLLQMLGLPVAAEGNVINVGGHKLEVARACNGLSMLLSFITLITAVAILVDRPLLDRIILLVSAVPIALVVNILRITITGLCYNFFGTDELLIKWIGVRLPHDWAGYLMMPIALVAVWLELRMLSWLMIVEEESPEAMPTFGQMSPGPRPPKKGEPGSPAEL
jgi:exosortase